ncbi:MAG: hypothetical protein CMJ19_14240 [Phycisphaeraceae bacterium]|nr:hypothetical protein [Phycisphaeraceae bacterium]
MAKKQKTKAKKAAKAPKGPKGPGKAKASSNVYTVMTFVATVMLSVALGFVLMRSAELFGSVGELFNLEQSNRPAPRSQPVTPAAQPDDAPVENQ